MVGTLGLPLSIYVAPVEVEDRDGARLLLAGSKPLVRACGRSGRTGVTAGNRSRNGAEGERLETGDRRARTKGRAFKVLAKRWIVERTFAWLGRSRRLSKDCERGVQTGETMIEVAMIRLLLRRLVPRI